MGSPWHCEWRVKEDSEALSVVSVRGSVEGNGGRDETGTLAPSKEKQKGEAAKRVPWRPSSACTRMQESASPSLFGLFSVRKSQRIPESSVPMSGATREVPLASL